jgi:ribosomal protein S18 acetylase RimI-like enzyme
VTVQIRDATVEDTAAIADIHVSGWRTAYRGVVPDQHLQSLSVEKRQAYWISAIEKGEPLVRVASGANGISGWVAFAGSRDSDARPRTGEVWAIYVAPTVWTQGVGRHLLTKACAELHGMGYSAVTLWVLAKNERACKFYERLGFVPEESAVKVVNIGGAELREVRYARELAS